jgi:hypothetical protein
MTTRRWLSQNGYDDIVRTIDKIETSWRDAGVSTRRNWWVILAGGRDGEPREVAGFKFPVLAAAQVHEGKRVTPNAVRRSRGEVPPEKDYRGSAIARRKRRK